MFRWFPSSTSLIGFFESWRRQAQAFASLQSPEQCRRHRVDLPTPVKPQRMSRGVLLTCSFLSKVSNHLRAVSHYLNNKISKPTYRRSQTLHWISCRMVWFSTSLLAASRRRLQYQRSGNNETPLARDDLNSDVIVAQVPRDDAAQGQDAPDVSDVLMPDAPTVHEIATPRRKIGGRCRKLQYGVGRQRSSKYDDQDHPIPCRSCVTLEFLLLLTSKLPFQMCLAKQSYTLLRKPMRISQLSSPSGTPAPRSTEYITIQLTPKSVPTVGWIRVVPCQRVDFQLLLAQYFVQSWRSFAHITIRVLNFSPTWTTGICGLNRNNCYRQLLTSLQPPDQSTLLYSRPRLQYGKVLARTPSHLNSKTRSHSPSAAWVDIDKSMETLSKDFLIWVGRPPWRKQHNAFRRLPPHLQTLTLATSQSSTSSLHTLGFVGRIHFHPKTISSTDTFIQTRFHPMTLSSKNGFIQLHFHPKHFHPILTQ